MANHQAVFALFPFLKQTNQQEVTRHSIRISCVDTEPVVEAPKLFLVFCVCSKRINTHSRSVHTSLYIFSYP